jgi:hypothetical protein
MHYWRQRATTLAVLLLLVLAAAAALAAEEPEDDDDSDKIEYHILTRWIYNGCETGSVDAPDSDDVYAWYDLRGTGSVDAPDSDDVDAWYDLGGEKIVLDLSSKSVGCRSGPTTTEPWSATKTRYSWTAAPIPAPPAPPRRSCILGAGNTTVERVWIHSSFARICFRVYRATIKLTV